MVRQLRRWVPLILTLVLSAFAEPQVGELVELLGFVNARSEARFRKIDQNVVRVLRTGTRARVDAVHFFGGSGNYGLKVSVIPADGSAPSENESVWVYYNVKNPAMKLTQADGAPTEQPRRAERAETTRDVPTVPEHPPLPPERPETFDAGEAKDTLTKIDDLNQLKKGQDPTPVCRDCQKPAAGAESCNSSNNYLERQMQSAGASSIIAKLLNATTATADGQSRMRSCVRESMMITGGNFFASCPAASGSARPGSAPRACVSGNLVQSVESAFTLSMRCLSPVVTGSNDQQSLTEFSRAAASLMNLESGFHVNAVNASGAAGLGQITDAARVSVNRGPWSRMMNQINTSSDPSCRQLKSMAPQPARTSGTCERMSLANGNPLVNVMYSVGHMWQTREAAASTLARGLRDNQISLSSDKRSELLTALTVWGHNTGTGGITKPLASALASSAGQSALRSGNVSQFLSVLKVHVSEWHRANGYGSRRATSAAGFYQDVQNKMNKLERRVGRSCAL